VKNLCHFNLSPNFGAGSAFLGLILKKYE